MSTLRVTLVQCAAEAEPAANRARLDDLIPADADDLVVLPEAFARDFGGPGSDPGPDAEPLDGPFVTELARLAADRRTTVIAGMFEQGTPRPWNTLVVRGAVDASYRKIHLYDSFGFAESEVVAPGPVEPVVLELGGFRIGLMTCYDLRFPELARALVDRGAQVLVVPAAWVAGPRKVDHWRTLVRARAIENVAYVCAVGQSGPRYCGHSMVVDPLGDVLAEAESADQVLTEVLDSEVVAAARRDNPSLTNRRM